MLGPAHVVGVQLSTVGGEQAQVAVTEAAQPRTGPLDIHLQPVAALEREAVQVHILGLVDPGIHRHPALRGEVHGQGGGEDLANDIAIVAGELQGIDACLVGGLVGGPEAGGAAVGGQLDHALGDAAGDGEDDHLLIIVAVEDGADLGGDDRPAIDGEGDFSSDHASPLEDHSLAGGHGAAERAEGGNDLQRNFGIAADDADDAGAGQGRDADGQAGCRCC